MTEAAEVNEFKIDWGPAELGGEVDDLSLPVAALCILIKEGLSCGKVD